MRKEFKAFSTLIIYSYIAYSVLYLYPFLFGHSYDKANPSDVVQINIFLDILLFIITVLLSIDILRGFKKVSNDKNKKEIVEFLKALLKSIIGFIAVKYVLGIIVGLISIILGIDQTSVNQQALETLFKLAPFAMFVTGAFLAPVTEELVFRGAIKRIIKNKRVFITVSGLIFGLVHIFKYNLPIFVILIAGYLIDMIVTSEMKKRHKVDLIICTLIVLLTVLGISMQTITGNLMGVIVDFQLSELVNGIMYVGVGCYFAYIYYKYDNIYINILVHVFNNLLAYIVLFTLL